MTDNLPQKRRKLSELTVDEKAKISHDSFYEWAKGVPYSELSRRHNIAPQTIKKLIIEYSAFIREEKPDTKAANEEAYRYLLGKAVGILERLDDPSVSALLKAKAFESANSSLTRLDKLGGHEAPTTNINVGGETLSDIVTKMFGPGGAGETISPMDMGMVVDAEESIEDADVVEEEQEQDD